MQPTTRKSPRYSLKLKACPKCGGDICRMRDTFGVYHQCAQCGREIRPRLTDLMPSPEASVANPTTAAAAPLKATHPGAPDRTEQLVL